MLEHPEIFEAFERDLSRRTPPDLARGLAIVEALLEEARLLGVWPPADPWEGLDAVLRLAQAVNRVREPA